MIWMIICLILFLLVLYGLFVEPHLIKVQQVKLGDKRHLRVAHFSDTHFSWHTSSARFKKFAQNMTENQPDVILFTGDLFDKVSWAKKQDLTALVQILTELSAPKGKFAILGNHDFDGESSDFVKDILERSGFNVLTNLSKRQDNFVLTGIDDWREGKPFFDILPEEASFSLLMIHEPDAVLQVKHLDKYDLVIAGHSHGGQIRLGKLRLHNEGSKYFDKGRYQISNRTILYVNSGIGLTFLPIRIGVPPELVYYEI